MVKAITQFTLPVCDVTFVKKIMARKSWTEKMQDGRQPVIEKADKDFAGVRTGQKMLIPTPMLVDEFIRMIPKGNELSPTELRNELALQYGAEVTCPLTTGIFLRIAAEAAYEKYEAGAPLKDITPFWRVISEKSPTAKKLSFGTEFLKLQRQKEKLS
jgi:hypothetical protein